MNEAAGSSHDWRSEDLPAVMTYVYQGPDQWRTDCQLQWDYQIEWPCSGKPTIRLLRYRSFQENFETKQLELVEEILQDIPVTTTVVNEISRHAAGYLSSCASLEGEWCLADSTFLTGCEESAKKRFSLSSFRQVTQVKPNQ